ncbi:MAG: glutamine--fructose-6-phosphate transaminase (isomerizing), partial [Pseudomonadota bacterium]
HKAGPVAVVHNGIIENYRELRERLAAEGVSFVTDTDTETVALLTQYYMKSGLEPVDAAKKTLEDLEGAYALCFLFEGEQDLIVAARKGSPLAIGHGDGEAFVGSDAIALAPLTDKITYLEEGDCAVVTRDSVTITDSAGRLANRDMRVVQIDNAQVDKAGHKHFMAKEIAEQPGVIGDALSHYLTADGAGIEIDAKCPDFNDIDRITLVACGTAYYACLTAKYWFEQVAGLPAEVDIASEFRYREPPIPARTMTIFVSQSGETADTLAALRYCEEKSSTLAVVNVAESSIAREAQVALPIFAGTEIGVASTKAFTCQLVVLLLLALKAARDRGTMDDPRLADILSSLRGLPALMRRALDDSDKVRDVAGGLSEAASVLFLGRGMLFPLALEGALKLKEISYIHAEGYASGELKHGPIALIDHKMPVVVMAPRDGLFDKTVSNMQEVMARDGKVCLVTDEAGASDAGDGVWQVLTLPSCDPLIAPILYAVPAQLLAYHTAVAKGTDVDQPRNLAKSVTVE